jgi:hypothetical protein
VDRHPGGVGEGHADIVPYLVESGNGQLLTR